MNDKQTAQSSEGNDPHSHAVGKVGDRVRLIWTDDEALAPGDEGTVTSISEDDVPMDETSNRTVRRKKYWVDWDDKGSLAVFEGYDRFEFISKK